MVDEVIKFLSLYDEYPANVVYRCVNDTHYGFVP